MFRHAPPTADNQTICASRHDTFQGLLVSLVRFRLDHGNATLAGLLANLLNQLQAVMNAGLVRYFVRADDLTPIDVSTLHRFYASSIGFASRSRSLSN